MLLTTMVQARTLLCMVRLILFEIKLFSRCSGMIKNNVLIRPVLIVTIVNNGKHISSIRLCSKPIQQVLWGKQHCAGPNQLTFTGKPASLAATAIFHKPCVCQKSVCSRQVFYIAFTYGSPLTRNMSWREHINTYVKKANPQLGFLARNLRGWP